MMQEREGAFDDRRIHALDAEFGRRVAGAFIVIAADQHEVERAMAFAPFGEGLEGALGAAGAGVEGVAQDHDAAALRALDGPREAVQIVGRRAHGDRDGVRAEGGGFAPVGVGEEERGALRPVDGALGQ
jgi:hypothetical protein